jgi:hypothetical protein
MGCGIEIDYWLLCYSTNSTLLCPLPLMEERNEKKEKITRDDMEEVTLEPITKAKSKEDKGLQEWEVESTGGGLGAGGG